MPWRRRSGTTLKQQGVLNVKNACLWALSAAVMLFSVCPTLAQQVGTAPVGARPMATPRSSNIALLNVAYLFDNHPRLKQMREEMKADVERADAAVKAEQENIKRLAEKLDQYRGTPDFKAVEEEVAKRSNDLKLQIALQRKEFMLREARMYHQTYQEIADEVKYYCEQNGIDVVLRFNADKVDLENPESVLIHVNKPVVYYATDRDITGIVLTTIYRRYGIDPAHPERAASRPTTPTRPAAPFNR